MTKKPYVSPIDTVSNQLYRLFSVYFAKGWISEGEIYLNHDMRNNGGLNFIQLRTLLRTECRRRGVPLVFVWQGYSRQGAPPVWGISLKSSAQTERFLLGLTLMTGVMWTEGMKQQLIVRDRMQRLALIGEDVAGAVLALLEQQPFIQKARAIGAEHYPPR